VKIVPRGTIRENAYIIDDLSICLN